MPKQKALSKKVPKSSMKVGGKKPAIKKKKRVTVKSSKGRSDFKSAPIAIAKSIKGSGPIVHRVVHKELLQDIVGSIAYNGAGPDNVYEINPGLISSFPWLGVIAQNYEQYRFTSLRWEYVQRCPSTTIGSLYMATSYDSRENPAFPSVQALGAYRNSLSMSVWESKFHNSRLEAGDYNKKYMIRTTLTQPSNTDIREYDVGTFTYATEGCASDSRQVGQLWVHYDVTLFNPRLPSAGSEYASVKISSGSDSGAFMDPTGFGIGNEIVRLPPRSEGKVGVASVGSPDIPEVFNLDNGDSSLTVDSPGVYEAVLMAAVPNLTATPWNPISPWGTISTLGLSLLDEVATCFGPAFDYDIKTNDFGYLTLRFLFNALVSGAKIVVNLNDIFTLYRRFSLKSLSSGPAGPLTWVFPPGVKMYYPPECADVCARMVRLGNLSEASYRDFLDYSRSPRNRRPVKFERKEKAPAVLPAAGSSRDRRDSVTTDGEEDLVVVAQGRRTVVLAAGSEPPRRSKSKDPRD